MVVRLILLLAVLYQARGQEFFYDLGSEIRQDGVSILSTASTNRQLCHDGANTFFTNGAQIQQIVAGSTPTVLLTAAANIDSLSCACNALAFTYQSGSSTFLEYRDRTKTDVYIKVALTSPGTIPVGRAVVRIDRESNKVIVVSTRRSWLFDLNLKNGMEKIMDVNIIREPHCIAAHTDGTDWYIFVSFAFLTSFRRITYDSGTMVATSDQLTLPDSAAVACLDIDNGRIYFLQESLQFGDDWELNNYAVNDWLSAPEPSVYAMGPGRLSGTTNALDDDVNGLVVCVSGCSSTNVCDTTCDCDTNTNCGFCVDNEPTCQCANSLGECCEYASTTLSDMCIVLAPPIDAFCVVKNPLAPRRKGDPVDVIGVSRVDASITMDRRTAKTGRWNVNALPIHSAIPSATGPTVWLEGFSAPVPSSGRGRRFGIYLVDIDPAAADLLTERLNCIVTEESGFFNEFYTYTGVVGGTVTMEATATSGRQASMRLSQLQWMFTRVDLPAVGTAADATPVSANCDSGGNGALTCTKNSLAETDEGVYEVFVSGIRRRRTWHPVFYLCVRDCGKNNYGSGCTLTCATSGCVNGYCDVSGNCVCYPGWMGVDCNTVCSLGMVGQACDIPCSAIDTNCPNCENLMFCLPGKLGCACSTGLQSPACTTACVGDTWGPNCQETCSVAACNTRDGS